MAQDRSKFGISCFKKSENVTTSLASLSVRRIYALSFFVSGF
jgi:hypothetical protein